MRVSRRRCASTSAGSLEGWKSAKALFHASMGLASGGLNALGPVAKGRWRMWLSWVGLTCSSSVGTPSSLATSWSIEIPPGCPSSESAAGSRSLAVSTLPIVRTWLLPLGSRPELRMSIPSTITIWSRSSPKSARIGESTKSCSPPVGKKSSA